MGTRSRPELSRRRYVAAGISWDAYDRFGQATLFKTAHNRIFSRVDLDPA